MYEKLTLKIRGVAPLLMHNGRLADPLNSHAKAMKKISGKRKKTEADFAELSRLEWYGSLYVHNGKPCIPGELFEAALVEGAKKSKRGQQAKAAIICDGFYSLEYDGPRDPDKLWQDENFRLVAGVRIQRNRVMRTRPIFRNWSAEIGIEYMPTMLDETEIKDIATTTGQVVGLGDWRPRFGRFEIVE